MREMLKTVAETIVLHPKTAASIPLIQAAEWIANNYDGVLSGLTKLGSFVLIIYLIRLHRAAKIKILLEIEVEKKKLVDSEKNK